MNKKLISIKNDLSGLKKTYLLCLVLVLSFGIYKNIICLLNTEIDLYIILSKILYIILGFGIGFLSDSLKNKKLTIHFNSIIGLIIGIIVPFKTNMILFILSLFLIIIIDYIDKNNLLNKICVIKLFIIIGMLVLGKYTYLNPLEATNEYAYTLVDNFVGNQIGGIFSTSVLLILISLIILSLNKIYKNKIALISLFSYLGVLVILLLTRDYMKIFGLMQNSSNIFAFVFIAPFSIYSPYKNDEITIYSIFIGVVSALISYFIVPNEGAIISILIANVSLIIWNNIHKTTKQLKLS